MSGHGPGGVTVARLSGTACWSLTGSIDWALGLTDENGLDRVAIGREFGGPPVPGTISFTTAFAPPTVSGFITAVPLLCSTGGGQTTFAQLDVTSFVATEGTVTLIP